MRRGRPPFIHGEEGMFHEICFDPLINAPNRPQNHHLGVLNLASTYGTNMGKAVGGNTRKMGPRHANSGAAAPRCHFWPNLRSAGLLDCIGHSCNVWLYLEHVCFGFWAFFSMWQGLDLPGKWAFSPRGSCPVMLRLVYCVFGHIFLVIPTCPPVNGKTPKLKEIISSKALCLSLVSVWMDFI
jgi:hypothetical protein